MGNQVDMGNVIIPEKHQSAPKEHPADRAIRQAAQEIHDGHYVEEKADDAFDLTIALGTGAGADAKRIAENPTAQDFQDTEDSLVLGRHPRVIEALERMKQEVDTSRTSQEYAEKSAALFELNQRQNAKQKWEGQERWEGKENEEMRIGLILTPYQFMERLERVIGNNRVFLAKFGTAEGRAGRERMTGRVPLMVPDKEDKLLAPNARLMNLTVQLQEARRAYHSTQDLQKRVESYKTVQRIEQAIEAADHKSDSRMPGFAMVATLQWPAGTEWMIMRFDEFGVPTTPKYLGWRTALLAMIRARVITEKEANKAFPVGSSPAAKWYKQQLHDWRNNRPEMIN